jgi:hypothetical protein
MSKKPKVDLIADMKKELLKLDPVSFCQNYLTVDGKPLDLSGGWKFWADIYRLAGISLLKKDAKPIVLLKGRQCGATTFSTAFELYAAFVAVRTHPYALSIVSQTLVRFRCLLRRNSAI